MVFVAIMPLIVELAPCPQQTLARSSLACSIYSALVFSKKFVAIASAGRLEGRMHVAPRVRGLHKGSITSRSLLRNIWMFVVTSRLS